MSINNNEETNELSYSEIEKEIFINYNDNNLYFTGEITDSAAHFLSMFIIKINNLKANDANKDVILHLNTPGGSIINALKVYDILRMSQVNIHCLVEGIVASAGTVIMCGCDSVSMTENSFIMVHEYWTGIQGKASEIDVSNKFNEVMYDKILKIYEKKTGSNLITKEWLKVDRYLDCDQALKLKLVDQALKEETNKSEEKQNAKTKRIKKHSKGK